MERLIIGDKRKRESAQNRGILGDIFFACGIAVICALLLSTGEESAEKVKNDDYTAVMSGAVVEREELNRNERAVAGEKKSFYDELGELFAGMIFGFDNE